MLPDFPKTKSEISKLLSARARLKTSLMSPFASLPRAFTQHEGNLHSYSQEGAGPVTQGFERFEVKIEIKIDEIPSLVGDRLLEKIDSIAEEMARKTSEHGFRVIDQAVEQTGNHMDAGGKPFDREMFLEMLEKTEISFDSNGKSDLIFLMHPTMAKAVQERAVEWEQDPAFTKRRDELMMLKKEAWLDRESNRKLVD